MVSVPNDPVLLLPHRPPFRFVDVVDKVEPGRSVRARYRITGEEPGLEGHFPGRPLLPSVLLLEALKQAAVIAILTSPEHASRIPRFGGIDGARFYLVGNPGDELELAVDIERLDATGGWAKGVIDIAGERGCEARLLVAFASAPDR